MVFYFYPELPITDWGSIVCPLTGMGKISRIRLRRDTRLTIHSLFVPIGRYVYPTNILTHSTFVKGEQGGNGGGYKALIGGSLKIYRKRRYWVNLAANGNSINTITALMTTKMVIDKPLQDIVMRPGYDRSGIDRETLYVDAVDNYRWKYKQLLRMDGVKTISYLDTMIKDHPPVVFDFEKSQITVTNREHTLITLDKVFYETTDGDLRSTVTNPRYTSNKGDLVQLALTNPSYLVRQTVVGSKDQDGLVLEGTRLSVYNDITLYCIEPQKAFLMVQPFWQSLFAVSKMGIADWLYLSTMKNASVYAEMVALRDKHWPRETWFKLKAGKGTSVSMFMGSGHVSATRYFVTYDIYSIDITDSVFYTDTTKSLSVNSLNTVYDLKQDDVRGLSSALVTHTVVRKAKETYKPTANTVLLLYNEYVNRIYYTPSNITTPLLGTVVAERHLPANHSDNYVYRNVTTRTVRGILADDVLTNQLEIQISDLGGRPLETVLDDANKRRPIKDILLDLNGTMTSKRQPSFTRGVLVSQESSRKYNNPIEAVIDNQELLTEMRQHLARGGRIVCEVVEVTIPSKFAYESNYVIIDVEGWAFPNVSYHNNNQPYWLAGYINLSVIKNFKQIQADDIYHAIQFTKSEMDPAPGKATKMAVTDVSDIKNFSLALKDATTLKLLQFSAGKYPMFHLEFKFYPRR